MEWWRVGGDAGGAWWRVEWRVGMEGVADDGGGEAEGGGAEGWGGGRGVGERRKCGI